MEETVSCFCNSCSAELGQFRNAWNVIGSNYYSPVYPILTYDDGFVGAGDVRSVKLGNHDPCLLQDLKCKTCRTYLGIRCDTAPSGHILKRNQYLLRLSEITSLIANTNKPANITVKNTFILESSLGPSKKSKSRAPSVEPSRSHAMTVPAPPRRASSAMPPPVQPASRMNGSGVSVAPSSTLKSLAPRMSQFEVWAEKEIKDQKKHITAMTGAVERLQLTVDEVKGMMNQFREERTKEQEKAKEAQSEINSKQLFEIEELKRQIDTLVKDHPKSIDDVKRFLIRQLLAESAKMGARVQYVDEKGMTGVQGVEHKMGVLETTVLALRFEVREVQDNLSLLDTTSRNKLSQIKAGVESVRSHLESIDQSKSQPYSSVNTVPDLKKSVPIIPPIPQRYPTSNSQALNAQAVRNKVAAHSSSVGKVAQADWTLANYDRAARAWVPAIVSSQQSATNARYTIAREQVENRLQPMPATVSTVSSSVIQKAAQDQGTLRADQLDELALDAPLLSSTASSQQGHQRKQKHNSREPVNEAQKRLASNQVHVINSTKSRATSVIRSMSNPSLNDITKRKTIMQVQIPAYRPDRIYPRVLSSPGDSESDTSSATDSELPAAENRKRQLSSDVDLEFEDSKRRKRTSRSSNTQSARQSREQNTSLELESPESELSEAKPPGSRNNPLTLDPSYASKQIPHQPVSIAPSVKEVSMVKSVAKRPTSSYGSSYHSASNTPTVRTSNQHRPIRPRTSLSTPHSGPGFNTALKARSQPIPRNSVLPSVGNEETPRHVKEHASSRYKNSGSKPDSIVNEAPTPEQISNPYKCGICEKRFLAAHSLKVHKENDLRCRAYTNRDSIPSEFICSGCNGSFTTLAVFNNHDCERTPSTVSKPPLVAAIRGPRAEDVESQRHKMEEQRRMLERRDQLVRETMEREMGMR